MRKLQIVATAASLALSSAALAQSQKEFTPEGSTGNWHDLDDWTPTGIPTLNDDVLIPSGKTCIVSGTNNDALCKSLEVGGTLEIQDGNTLQIRTPVSHGFTALELNGTIEFADATETGVLLLEMTGSGDRIFEILGEGELIGDPAQMLTDSGSNAIDRVYVGAADLTAATVTGTWDIFVDVENDGLFTAESGHIMTFDTDTCSAPGGSVDILLSGDGTFSASGGTVYMINPEFESGFDGTLAASGVSATMILGRCNMQGGAFDVQAADITVTNDASIVFLDGLTTDGATITLSTLGATSTDVNEGGAMTLVDTTINIDEGTLHADGDALLDGVTLTIVGDGQGDGVARFADGFSAESCQISIDDGRLFSDNLTTMQDTTVSLVGASLFDCDDNITGTDVAISAANTSSFTCVNLWILGINDPSITLSNSAAMTVDGKLSTGDFKAQGETITIDVNDSATLDCEWFDFDDCDLTIEGTFDVAGHSTDQSEGAFGSISIAGGSFKIAGGFSGSTDVIIIINGLLEIRTSTNNHHVFKSTGLSQFLGGIGSIKVKQGEKVQLE